MDEKERHKDVFCHDRCDKLKELVIVRSSIEIPTACFGGSKHESGMLSQAMRLLVSIMCAKCIVSHLTLSILL